MGQSQSSHASSDTPVSSVAHMKTSPDSVGGRKSETATITLYSTEPSLPNDSHKETAEEPIKNSLVANAISVVAENEEKEEEEYDVSSDEESDDEEWNERLRILDDVRQLKMLAEFFLHPEKPVKQNPCVTARCFFDRPSAPGRRTWMETVEQERIMEDLIALKKLAVDYLHPELPVVTNDPCACGRNYFTRPSAPDQETEEDAEERRLVLAEAQELKKLAVDYLHPERPVMTTDPNACGRNYFTRPSAKEYESAEDAAERTRILAEVQELKRLAVDYLHPERPVRVVDGTLFGRSYFTRPSAPEQESFVEAEQRARILEDARQLKKLAMDYLHPELGVRASDPRLFGRNFFKRASAPEQDSFVAAEERARILEDAKMLKKLAVDYLHPELPVVTNDPCACGRNYFTRPSAPDQETEEDAEERRLVLAEAQELKKLAVDYLHPERPVMTTDPNACGRNYFTRPSADEYESAEDAAERTRILAEVQELKRLAVDYLHPERPVRVVDGTLFGRSYFARPSAPEQESFMEAEQRARILEDARQLKKLAMDYLHPELGVRASDPRLFGRNYFKGPHNMIHTFPSHVDEEDHTDHHDHFGMDEDMDIFADMRSNFIAAEGNADVVVGKTEEGNNLSRSPSSVMLFSGESMYD